MTPKFSRALLLLLLAFFLIPDHCNGWRRRRRRPPPPPPPPPPCPYTCSTPSYPSVVTNGLRSGGTGVCSVTLYRTVQYCTPCHCGSCPAYRVGAFTSLRCCAGRSQSGDTCPILNPCSTPSSIASGSFSPSTGRFEVGARVTYSCSADYQLSGNAVLTCILGPSWSPAVLPRCIPKPCSAPPVPANATISGTPQTKYDVGKSVKMTCTGDYRHTSGDANRTCLVGNRWSGSAIVCEPPCKSSFIYGPFKNSSSCGDCGACIHLSVRKCRDNCGLVLSDKICEDRGMGLPAISRLVRLPETCDDSFNFCTFNPCSNGFPLSKLNDVVKSCIPSMINIPDPTDSYACECQAGFTSYGNGRSCQDINECALENSLCRTGGKLRDGVDQCYNTIGSYRCVCKKGYRLNGRECVDLNECETNQNTCSQRFGRCVNTVGSFECACNSSFHNKGLRGNCCKIFNFKIPAGATPIFEHSGKLNKHIRSPIFRFSLMKIPVGKGLLARNFYITSTGVIAFLDDDQTQTNGDDKHYKLYYDSHCKSDVCNDAKSCRAHVNKLYDFNSYNSSAYWRNWWWQRHNFHCSTLCNRLCKSVSTFDQPWPMDQVATRYPQLNPSNQQLSQRPLKGAVAHYWTDFQFRDDSKIQAYLKSNDNATPSYLEQELNGSTIPNKFSHSVIVKFTNVYDVSEQTQPMTFYAILGTADANTYGFTIFDHCKQWLVTSEVKPIHIGYWFQPPPNTAQAHSFDLKKTSVADFYDVYSLSGKRGDQFGSNADPPAFLSFRLSSNPNDFIHADVRCRRWLDENKILPQSFSHCHWFGSSNWGQANCFSSQYYPQFVVSRWCPRIKDNIVFGYRSVYIAHLPPGLGCYQPTSSQLSWQGYMPICCYTNDAFAFNTGSNIDGGEFQGLPAGVVMRGSPDNHFSRFREQLLAYKACCIDGREQCWEFLMYRPFSTNALVRGPSNARGDPHISTLDGLVFTFNGHGQFILLKGMKLDSETGEVQGILITCLFQTPRNSRNFTVTTGVAMQATVYGKSNYTTEIVEFSLNHDHSAIEVRINKTLYNNITTMELKNGLTIRIHNGSYQAIFATGVVVEVKMVESILAFDLMIDVGYRGNVSGLLGNYNSDPSDDLENRNGTIVLPANSTDKQIFPIAMTWAADCDDPMESLFDYSSVPCARLFNASYRPTFTTDDLFAGRSELRAAALRVCGNNSACMFDVSQTGNLNLGKATKEGEEATKASKEAEENAPPQFAAGDTVLRLRVGEDGSHHFNVTDPDPQDSVTLTISGSAGIFTLNDSVLSWSNVSDSGQPANLTVVAVDSRGQSTVRTVQIQFCRCKNGGGCRWLNNSSLTFTDVACNCSRGYSGRHCDYDEDGCASKPCHTACTDVPVSKMAADRTNPGFVCAPCPAGLTGNGQTCEDVDECNNSTGDCEQLCINTVGSYRCSCRPGYVAARDRCLDIDECALRTDICGPNADCRNSEGSYQCVCRSGYRRLTNGTCANIDECSDGEDPCAADSNSLCRDRDGGYECVCRFGFLRNGTGACAAINFCLPTNNCTQRCVNAANHFRCACEEGFELASDRRSCNATRPCSDAEEELCVGGGCGRLANGSTTCVCPPGRAIARDAADRAVCTNVDECADPKLNSCGPLGLATCHDASPGYSCACADGYVLATDRITCVDEDECATERHRCDLSHGSCVNTNGSHYCSCGAGFEKRTNATGHVTCVDLDECTSGTHQCNATGAECHNVPGTNKCRCRPGYSGDGSVCEDVDECGDSRRSPCDLENGVCTNTEGSYVCSCRAGFRRSGSRAACADVDECQLGANRTGCWSDALCRNVIGSYQCLCPDLMMLKADGKTCQAQKKCPANNSCGGVACALSSGKEVCVCPAGSEWNSRTKVCDDIDECARAGATLCPASGLVRCVNHAGGYHCECLDPKHQERRGVRQCVDKDECADGAVWKAKCHVRSKVPQCRDVVGGFQCVCPAGYKDQLTPDVDCDDIDECGFGLHNCSAAARCANVVGGYNCVCPSGYRPTGGRCVDVNECANANGGCAQRCSNRPGGRECSCTEGYQRRGDGCADVDECAAGTANCSQLCRNNVGGFACACQEGFEPAPGDNATCRPQLPCSVGHTCSHLCVRVKGTETCVCPNPSGWRLGADGRTCSDVNECSKGLHTCGANSECVNSLGSYTCRCRGGFQLHEDGRQCVDRDGGWAAWSTWSKCSATCGGGVRSRNRSCSAPTAAGRGLQCLRIGRYSRGAQDQETQLCGVASCPLTADQRPHAVYMVLQFSISLSKLAFEKIVEPALRGFLSEFTTDFCNPRAAACCRAASNQVWSRWRPATRLSFVLPRQVRFGSDTPLIRQTQVTASIYMTPSTANPLCGDLKPSSGRRKRSATAEFPLPVDVLLAVLSTLQKNETFASNISAALKVYRIASGVEVIAVNASHPQTTDHPTSAATDWATTDRTTADRTTTDRVKVNEKTSRWLIILWIVLPIAAVAFAVAMVIICLRSLKKRKTADVLPENMPKGFWAHSRRGTAEQLLRPGHRDSEVSEKDIPVKVEDL